MDSEAAERRLAALLSADAVAYARLMAEDEAATVRTINAYREMLALLVPQNGGRLIDFTGDNFLAEFPTALDAVRCAMEAQRVLGARNAGLDEARRMDFRMGVHLGDIRVERDRIFGTGINVAARLRELAEPGGICGSDAIREQVEGKLECRFEDLGEQLLKNLARPVRAHRIVPAQDAPPARTEEVDVRARIRSIAVLPLENLSGDPAQEPFVDGITEALISELAKIGSLRVVSRTSVRQYKGTQKSLREIARELAVEGVIEGSVVREGDRVRVTVQLIDGREDRHLWVEQYERDVRGILALQSEIARTVAKEIRLELTAREEELLAGPLGRWFARVRRIGIPED